MGSSELCFPAFFNFKFSPETCLKFKMQKDFDIENCELIQGYFLFNWVLYNLEYSCLKNFLCYQFALLSLSNSIFQSTGFPFTIIAWWWNGIFNGPWNWQWVYNSGRWWEMMRVDEILLENSTFIQCCKSFHCWQGTTWCLPFLFISVSPRPACCFALHIFICCSSNFHPMFFNSNSCDRCSSLAGTTNAFSSIFVLLEFDSICEKSAGGLCCHFSEIIRDLGFPSQ